MNVGKYAKAIVAAFAAGAAALVVVVGDGNLNVGDGVSVALSVLTALGITYAVPNSPDAPKA